MQKDTKFLCGEYNGYSWHVVRLNTKQRMIPVSHFVRIDFAAKELIDTADTDLSEFERRYNIDLNYGHVGRYLFMFKKLSG
jgi:hypothetical protein